MCHTSGRRQQRVYEKMPEFVPNGEEAANCEATRCQKDYQENDLSSKGKASGESHLESWQNQNEIQERFGEQLKVIKMNGQVKELQTILRDRTTERGDFVFYADRLIRLIVEEGLNQLPYEQCVVQTPTGASYKGLAFQSGNCGVSIMRSGEAMEKGLRDCCRSIRIGKILIQVNEDTKTPMVYYAKFPPGIESRRVLLMYPLLNSGATVITAINVLLEHGVKEEKILLLNCFATPQGVIAVLQKFPTVTILTSEVHSECPGYFGQKYFGTD